MPSSSLPLTGVPPLALPRSSVTSHVSSSSSSLLRLSISYPSPSPSPFHLHFISSVIPASSHAAHLNATHPYTVPCRLGPLSLVAPADPLRGCIQDPNQDQDDQEDWRRGGLHLLTWRDGGNARVAWARHDWSPSAGWARPSLGMACLALNRYGVQPTANSQRAGAGG